MNLEKDLQNYILLHCAKTELSLIDVASGTTFHYQSEENQAPSS